MLLSFLCWLQSAITEQQKMLTWSNNWFTAINIDAKSSQALTKVQWSRLKQDNVSSYQTQYELWVQDLAEIKAQFNYFFVK